MGYAPYCNLSEHLVYCSLCLNPCLTGSSCIFTGSSICKFLPSPRAHGSGSKTWQLTNHSSRCYRYSSSSLSESINQSITPVMLTQGHFSTHRERAKCNKYGEAASIIGARFIQLVLETYGQMGQSMQNFLRRTATELFNRSWNYDPETSLDLKSRLVKLWTARVSSVLQRANTRLLMSKSAETFLILNLLTPPPTWTS